MWPKIEYESDGFMLAACHAIGRNAVIDEDVALFLADNLLTNYRDLIDTRYKLSEKQFDVANMDNVDLLEAIAKRRSYRRKDGEWDLERTSMAFLTDYRNGVIGRISMESPTSRQAMIDALATADKSQAAPEKPLNQTPESDDQ